MLMWLTDGKRTNRPDSREKQTTPDETHVRLLDAAPPACCHRNMSMSLTSASAAHPPEEAPEAPEAQSDVADAAVTLFGDPLRAAIVRMLSHEQMCTCHLVNDTGARQSTISHHLRILREAGFVAAEPHGRYTYYRLRPEALSELTVGIAGLAARAHHAQVIRRPCT